MKFTQAQITALQTSPQIDYQMAIARAAKTNYFVRPLSIPLAYWNTIPQVIAAKALLARYDANHVALTELKNAVFANAAAKRDDAIEKLNHAKSLATSTDIKALLGWAYYQYDQAIAQGAPISPQISAESAAFTRQMAIDASPSGIDSFLNVAVPLALAGIVAAVAAPAIMSAVSGAGAPVVASAGTAATTATAATIAPQSIITSMTGAGISDATIAQSIAGAAASVSTTTAAAAAHEMASASWETLVTGNVASIGSTAMQIAQNLPTPQKAPLPTTPASPVPPASNPLPSVSAESIAGQVANTGVKVVGGLATTALTGALLPPVKKPIAPVANAPVGAAQSGMATVLLGLLGVGAAIYLM